MTTPSVRVCRAARRSSPCGMGVHTTVMVRAITIGLGALTVVTALVTAFGSEGIGPDAGKASGAIWTIPDPGGISTPGPAPAKTYRTSRVSPATAGRPVSASSRALARSSVVRTAPLGPVVGPSPIERDMNERN
jgi:hypothetical protein